VRHPWFHSPVFGFLFTINKKNPGWSPGVEITEVHPQPAGSTSGKCNASKGQQSASGQRQSSQTDRGKGIVHNFVLLFFQLLQKTTAKANGN
jgi:hypothetical protein